MQNSHKLTDNTTDISTIIDNLLADINVPLIVDTGNKNSKKEVKKKRLASFHYYGGKITHLNFLLPLLPPADHYCEVFGGSAAVLLNREPSLIETFNDLDSDVYNFFKVLQCQPAELIRLLSLTPYSREFFGESVNESGTKDIERAYNFFVISMQSYNSILVNAQWSCTKRTSRNGMSISVSNWLNGIERLGKVYERLRRVQIENDNAIKIIRRFGNDKDTLLYCDPPYPHECRSNSQGYKCEMSEDDHSELAEVLNTTKSKVAISTYDNDLYRKLYKGWNWIEAPEKSLPSSNRKRKRQEILLTNYSVCF